MSAAIQNEMERLRSERDAMKRQLDDAIEREAALAAHVERMAAEMKRCMSFLHCHFPSSDKDAAFYAAKQCVENTPATSLARHTLLAKAEVLTAFADRIDTVCGSQRQVLRQAYDLAADLRQQAKELT